LANLLKNAKGKERFEVLTKLADLKANDQEGVRYALEAIDVAKKLDDKYLSDSYDNLAFIYSFQELDDQALTYYQKSLEASQRIGYHTGVFRALFGIAQSYYYLDSLEQSRAVALKLLDLATKADSVGRQAKAMYQLGKIFERMGNLDSALVYMNKALLMSKKGGKPEDIAKTYNGLGQLYFAQAEYPKSIDCYLKEIEIKEANNDIYGLAVAYLNLGNTKKELGNYQSALEDYQKALQKFESLNNKKGIAIACNGIGMVYENLSQSVLDTKQNEANFNKALEYYQRALADFRALGIRDYEGSSLQNIANVYSRLATNQFVAQYGEEWEDSLSQLSSNVIMSSFGRSTDYYNQALDIFTETRNESEIAKVNINLGSTYSYARSWAKADKYLNEGLRIARRLNLPYEISAALYALGESNLRQGKTDVAESQFLECADISKKLGLKETMRYCYDRLSRLYTQTGDIGKAFAYHKRSVKIKDEIFSEKSQKIITEMQTKYETDKKEQENRLLKNEAELQESVIQRQRLMIIGAVIGVILILIVALLMFRMYREKRKANRILEEKNELITHQKQEITDSIRYASRIQRAVLPSDDVLQENLPEHFVLYMPRDIVSGDFFWLTRRGSKVVIVAADCTGHGVPGAFMSMLGVSFLYEIVNKEGIMQPAAILNFLRIHIKTTLSQKGRMDEQKDGMDISLCVLDRAEMKLEWAGAYNPLYFIRNGELTEYKADKMPIAIHMNDHLPFTNHEISIQKGDTFYISSDGYADQFGGADGRKFMSKKFKELLVANWNRPMQEQREILQKAHYDWKGDREQVDDILVMGVRV